MGASTVVLAAHVDDLHIIPFDQSNIHQALQVSQDDPLVRPVGFLSHVQCLGLPVGPVDMPACGDQPIWVSNVFQDDLPIFSIQVAGLDGI